MTEQRKRHFLIFLPVWIIPVFLITFGSLINFHQHRIWGEQLMPHSFVAPRDKAKIVKIQDVKNHSTDFFTFENIQEILVSRPVIQVIYCVSEDDPGSRHLLNVSLRAPPSA